MRSASGKTMRSSLSKCLREAVDRAEQDFFGGLQVARLVNLCQLGLDQLMFVVKCLLLADLVKAMLQRFHEQIILGFGVRRHDLFHDGGERLHLGQSLEPRRGGLDVVKQVMEHRVFRAQNVGDFHGCRQLAEAPILMQEQIHLPPGRFGGKTKTMNAPKADLLRAIELALAGEWDAAHQLVQCHEADATAAWIHAVLHKIEGDLGNARYWYRRADRLDRVADEPRAELAAIQAELRSKS